MIIPLGTDAPIYHWPYGTIGLIVVNTITFFVSGQFSDEAIEPWKLVTGDVISPIQWLTHLFLHADPIHLIGNMLFLWCFGLVVEGKIGTFFFLLLYLAIGIIEGATIQFMLHHADPDTALGASGAIYGLLAVCLIWAPANSFNCFYFFLLGFRIFTGMWEIPIVWFALFYFATEIFGLLFTGMTLSSELGHMTGAVWGLLAGVILFKTGLVDCEGWDAFSRWKKYAEHKRALWTAGAPQKKKRRRTSSSTPRGTEKTRAGLSDEQRFDDARRRISRMLEQGMGTAALQAHRKAADQIPGWSLQEPEYLALIKALHEEQAWAESVPLLREFIARFPQKADRVQLRLAQILIRELQKPTAGRRALQAVNPSKLPPELATVHRKLSIQADQMLEEGVLELEGDD